MSLATHEHAPPAAQKQTLVNELIEHALLFGDFELSSGTRASYLIDAKRVILQAQGFKAVAGLIDHYVCTWKATAIGGLTMGADPIAYAAMAHAAIVREVDLKAFAVRKEPKKHGLKQLIEGPLLSKNDRCLVVDDVVTTGSSTVKAIEALQDAGFKVCGVVAVLDRLAGGAEKIEAAAGAPFAALTTIDDVYPDRPDRG
jgi:orotate phosphoribosyltransferase